MSADPSGVVPAKTPAVDCWLCGQPGERISSNRSFRYCPRCDVRWGISLVTAGHRATHAAATDGHGALVMDPYIDHGKEHCACPA